MLNGNEIEDAYPSTFYKVAIDGKAKRTLKMSGELKLSFSVKPESARVVTTWTSSDNKMPL